MKSPANSRGKERRDLSARQLAREYGLRVAFRPRWRGWLLATAVLLGLGAAIGLYVADRIDGETAGAAAAALAAIAAIVFNAFESRRAMEERSLEGLYERIDLANKLLLETKQAAGAARPADRDFEYYVFTELDNLELAVAKYRRGALTSTAASRAVRTFEHRCSDELFCACATDQIEDPSYMECTRVVVDHVLARERARRERRNSNPRPPA